MKISTIHAGFSLLELMIAMAIFLVIGGVTLGLFSQHMPLFNRQQDQAALNIQIRNSIMQLQTDVVNGGSGYLTGTNLPSGALGITITNCPTTNCSSPTACNTPSTFTYSSTCFDTLNIISAEPTVPAAHPDSGTFSFLSTDCATTNSGSMWVYPVVPATLTEAQAATALAASYANAYTNLKETELLMINAAGTQMTTLMLTSAPTASVKNGVTTMLLSFQSTSATGWNSAANDPLNISVTNNGNPQVGTNQFCSSDWILQLSPITYSVSTATPTNPRLMRTQNGVSTALAQQVIGFKVGAILLNTIAATNPCLGTTSTSIVNDDSNAYCYDSSSDGTTAGGYSSQWTKIRSVQISLIGRTTPNPGAAYTYRNSFDNGPYQIEGVNVVIDPRNMSMNDTDF